jgi:hypothetical protein
MLADEFLKGFLVGGVFGCVLASMIWFGWLAKQAQKAERARRMHERLTLLTQTPRVAGGGLWRQSLSDAQLRRLRDMQNDPERSWPHAQPKGFSAQRKGDV